MDASAANRLEPQVSLPENEAEKAPEAEPSAADSVHNQLELAAQKLNFEWLNDLAPMMSSFFNTFLGKVEEGGEILSGLLGRLFPGTAESSSESEGASNESDNVSTRSSRPTPSANPNDEPPESTPTPKNNEDGLEVAQNPLQPPTLTRGAESLERLDIEANEAVYIGASNFLGYEDITPGTDFIGGGGKPPSYILEKLRREKERHDQGKASKLTDKKLAIIQPYGNREGNTMEELMDNLDTSVRYCKEAGIDRCAITLRIPFGSDLSSPKVIDWMRKVREAILKRFGDDPRVVIVDLYTPFVKFDENGKDTGFVKDIYDRKGGNNIAWHLWNWTYPRAIEEIARGTNTNLDEHISKGWKNKMKRKKAKYSVA